MASRGEPECTFRDGLFDKFMMDFQEYMNLELLGKFLIKRKLISKVDLARVLGEETNKLCDKIEEVVTIVRRKGQNAFVDFAEALQECQEETPDGGNDVIVMKIADELAEDPPGERKLDQTSIDYTGMLVQVIEQLKARKIAIDKIKFCLGRITSISAPTIELIKDYTTLIKVLERGRHLAPTDCDVLILLATTLKCGEIVRTVESYSRHCGMPPCPLTMEPPSGYTILSSEVSQQPEQAMSIGGVRQIKNTMRQSSRLLNYTDITFQGCETDNLLWQTSSENSKKLLQQFHSAPKKFRVEGIVGLKEMKQEQVQQHHDNLLPAEEETDSPIPIALGEVDPVNPQDKDQFKCILCLALVSDPHQTTCCGQHICFGCIRQVTQPRCPYCKKEKFNCFRDINMGRRVDDLEVFCTNKELGCIWSGKRRDLLHHLSLDKVEGSCNFVSVKCPNNGCAQELQRRVLKSHIRECQYQLVACATCNLKMTVLEMNNKHTPCPALLVTCPIPGCKESVQQSHLSQHKTMCGFLVVSCPIMGCDVELQQRRLDDHLKNNVIQHQLAMSKQLFLLQDKHNEDLQKAKEEFEGKLKNLQPMLTSKLENVQQKLDDLEARQGHLAKNIDEMKRIGHFINGMTKIAFKLRTENWRLFLHSNAEFITQLDRAVPVIVSLQNYSAKLEESSKPGGTSFRTVRFHSRRGYKMYLNVNPSSQGTRKDRYLAVFVNITSGENDDKLEWPYDGKVRVKLLNQLYDEGHYTYKKEYHLSRSNPDVKLHCITKPTDNHSNPGWGYTDFIMSERLKKQEGTPRIQYLVNDKLFFEIDAD